MGKRQLSLIPDFWSDEDMEIGDLVCTYCIVDSEKMDISNDILKGDKYRYQLKIPERVSTQVGKSRSERGLDEKW